MRSTFLFPFSFAFFGGFSSRRAQRAKKVRERNFFVTKDQLVIVSVIASTLYDICTRGILVALGTANTPVVFTSLHDDEFGGDTDGEDIVPQRGDWAWVEFAPTSNDQACLVQHAVFRYGGNAFGTNLAAIRIRSASPTITDSVFHRNRGFAIDIDSAS